MHIKYLTEHGQEFQHLNEVWGHKLQGKSGIMTLDVRNVSHHNIAFEKNCLQRL
jgi:hypothetical protein